MGIYIAAGIATIISLVALGSYLYWGIRKERKFFLFVGLSLPFSFIVNQFVKEPIGVFLQELFHLTGDWRNSPWWFLVILLFLSPFTEEAIKLFPVLVTPMKKRLRIYSDAFGVGFALGLGFGIGEIWYIAWSIFKENPQMASLPFYKFSPFISERLLVCFIHGILTLIVVTGIFLGIKKAVIYYLGAVLLHAGVNVGAMIYQIWILPSESSSQESSPESFLASLLIIPSIILLAFILDKLLKKAQKEFKKEGTERVLFRRVKN